MPGIERIRFATGHPAGCTEELADAMTRFRPVAPHLHLPVQSGSDRVLKRMRRGYTVEGYRTAIARIRRALPECAITTDVIVGFPGESEEDFWATRELFSEIGFDNSFIFKYSPRPGTVAAEWDDDVPREVKDERNRVLLEDQDRIGRQRNDLWLGKEVEVLVEGVSLRDETRWSGRSGHNKIVIFEPRAGVEPGTMVKVLIDEARPQTLYGKIVE